MNYTSPYRKHALSAPQFTFLLGDEVLCRENPAHHEFPARVVGVTGGAKPTYDVRDRNEKLYLNIQHIRLNEAAMAGRHNQ